MHPDKDNESTVGGQGINIYQRQICTMMCVAGSILWTQVLIFLSFEFWSQIYTASIHNESHDPTLCLLSNESASLRDQYKTIANTCHPANITGISSDRDQATCAFSEYLNIIHEKVHASKDLKKRIINFKNHFDSLFNRFNSCNFTLELDTKKKLKKDYAIKCLGLHVLETLALWFRQNNYHHKCV